MIMTKEEAIKHLLHDWHINLGCDFAIKPGRLDDFLGALDVALSALRPITREQVEKAWSGCSYCEDGDLLFEHSGLLLEISRAKDFDRAGIMVEGVGGFSIHFCPMCGRPLNDEAVDMVMERLEALKDGKGDD